MRLRPEDVAVPKLVKCRPAVRQLQEFFHFFGSLIKFEKYNYNIFKRIFILLLTIFADLWLMNCHSFQFC